jgi:hypothetical protein
MSVNCDDLEKAISLYLYDELTAEERGALEAHLAACEGCRVKLEEARRLHRALSECAGPAPKPELLARCRQALDEALDREQLGWRGLLRAWRWQLGAAPAPRLAAVVALVLFGFGLGWTLRSRSRSLQPAAPVQTAASFLGGDLDDLRIRHISEVAPDPQSGGVRITLDAERRVTLEGSLDDPRIRQVLVDTVRSYDNPGIRRDTLEALRTHRNNPAVRAALLYAILHDPNAGMRLEALTTVRGMEPGRDVQEALLGALEHDTNPGVRVAAVNALVEQPLEEGEDETVTPVLVKLAASDQNPYVRIQCQNAVRKMKGSGE